MRDKEKVTGIKSLPAVNLVQNLIRLSFSMFKIKVVSDPLDQMVLKCSFDKLVQQVRRQHLMDVGPRKVVCKWLYEVIRTFQMMSNEAGHRQ
jgi:hypothetical protein